MGWLGLDIGGANLKIADGQGFAHSVAFPLWRRSEHLAAALREMLAQAPPANSLAVTMTGELADCFATKAEGVSAILDAVEQAANGRSARVYLCDGRLVDPGAARAEATLAGASNWHVLADFVRRYCAGGQGLLIDIGSTTCDIIPLDRSGPCASGKTDPERLIAGELIYSGVERSPICAIVSQLPWRGELCPVAQELFGTTQDAYLLLGEFTEDPDNFDTADGRPCTKANARARLARMVCADSTMYSIGDAQRAAAAISEAQLELLSQSAQRVVDRMTEPPKTVIISGQGEFLARRLIERLGLTCEVLSVAMKLGPKISRSACAHALAVLACERADT